MVRKYLHLPPMTEEGLIKYFLRRGYQLNPPLQDDVGADFTFVKPLPKGGRKHVRVWIQPTRFKVEQHVDRVDPSRNPIGHLIDDVIIDGAPHEVFYASRKRRKYRARRRKRAIV